MKDLGKESKAAPEARALAPHAVRLLRISTEEAGQRVDNFLLRLCKGVPKTHVYRVIRDGQVRVNKKRIDPDYRLQEGDKLRVPPIRIAAKSEAPVPPSEFPVIFEDTDLLIIDKPAGVAVHGGSGISYGVIEQLRRARPQAAFLELVHRLDRETSGVLMIAKKRSALLAMHAQLKAAPDGGDKAMDKRYLALVKGRVANDRQHVRVPLRKTVGANGERVVYAAERNDADAQTAHTVVNVVERFADATLLEAELRTGRTHQIRVHLAHLGHPILGDERYGDFELNKALAKQGLKRMFLHAAVLTIAHPRSGEPLTVAAPLPNECERYLEKLRAEKLRGKTV
jgi:23S rRNA pseudouridine955/2504/2580 synthase